MIAPPKVITQIIALVSERTGVQYSQMRERTKTPRICEARDLAIDVLNISCSLTTTEIGEIMDRTHGAVSEAIRRSTRRVEQDERYAAALNNLLDKASEIFDQHICKI